MWRRSIETYQNLNGPTAYLNGQNVLSADRILQKIITIPGYHLCTDVFMLGDDDQCTPVDVSLSEQISKYPPINDENSKPVQPWHDFHFDIDYRWDTMMVNGVYQWKIVPDEKKIMTEEISFLLDGISEPDKTCTAVTRFIQALSFARLSEVHRADESMLHQLNRCVYFGPVTRKAVLFIFGDMAMLMSLISES